MKIFSNFSFTFRSRCKFCSGKPLYQFFYFDAYKGKDYRSQLDLKSRRKSQRLQLNENSKFLGLKINNLSIRPSQKISSSPYKRHLYELSDDILRDFIACRCRKTLWEFRFNKNKLLKNNTIRFDSLPF